MNDYVAVGIFVVVACERITEYFLTLVFAAIGNLKEAWANGVGDGIKAIIAAVINAGMYWLLFRYDFVTPALENIGITIEPWQGMVFCTLLVAGGSNLVHQFFSFFQNGRK